MVEIKEQSRELTPVEKYLLTTSPAIITLNKVPDTTVIPVSAYLCFTDVNKTTGETSELLSILTPDNVAYCCQSTTFKEYFKDIVKIAEGKPFSVIKMSGKTKAGRDFIYCELDVTSLS